MKNAVKLTTLSTIILLGGLSLTALAEGQRPGFETLDIDSDGRITQEEMQAHRAQRFQTMDANGDGKLDETELTAQGEERAKKRASKMLERLDTNGDNALSEDELKEARKGRGGMGRMFKRADADGDGAITKAEFDAAKERMKERRKKN